MQLLSIFNNGSQLWILLVAIAIIATVAGVRAAKVEKLSKGIDSIKDSKFWFALAAIVLVVVFILIINADYR